MTNDKLMIPLDVQESADFLKDVFNISGKRLNIILGIIDEFTEPQYAVYDTIVEVIKRLNRGNELALAMFVLGQLYRINCKYLEGKLNGDEKEY